MENKITNATITRTIVLFIALLNQALASFGKSPLPFNSEELTEFISNIITIGAALWAYWGNNSITVGAKLGDKIMNAVNKGKIDSKAVEEFLNNHLK